MMVALAVLVIAVFNVQGWLVLARTSRALEQELGDRLQAIAMTLAQTADRLQLTADSLQPGHQTEDRTKTLTAVMNDNRLFNLFVVNDRFEYLTNLRGPELVGSGDPSLDLDMTEILSAFSGIPAQSRLYRAGSSYLKTAYAPVRDSSGLVSAVLGVEADATFFSALAGFRNSLLLVNLLSLLAVAAIVVVSAAMARRAWQLEQAAARAGTLALMGQMSAAVAHEVKNPLAIIRAAAERVKRKLGPVAPPEIDYIPEEVDRLSGIVSNYLGVGVSRPGKTERLDIAALVRGVMADLKHQADKAGVRLDEARSQIPEARMQKSGRSDPGPLNPEPGPFVLGNRNELRQVFLNILLNAIQCQLQGGRVEVGFGEEHGRAVVRVKDSGPGIDAKVLKRVFEPFYTTKEKGSGLGLFVVKRIVEAHGGRVAIEAEPGKGTTVQVGFKGEETKSERRS